MAGTLPGMGMKPAEHRFKGLLVGRGPKLAWVFLAIPFDVHEVLGSRARVPVRGTLNGFPFRNSLLPNGDGTHSMAVNKQLLAGARAKAGDTVSAVMVLDTAERTVAVPRDLDAALRRTKAAGRAFAGLSHSGKKDFVDWIEQAKRPETRLRRLHDVVAMVIAGKKRRD